MSLIKNNVHLVDQQLDRLGQQICDPDLDILGPAIIDDEYDQLMGHISLLENIVNALSVTSKTQPLLRSRDVVGLISKVPQLPAEQYLPSDTAAVRAINLSWLATGKATAQTLGVVLKTLLDQTISLNDEIFYWEDVFASHWHSAFYALQTFPVRLWRRLVKAESGIMIRNHEVTFLNMPVRATWTRLYDSVRRYLCSQHLRLILTPTLAAPRSEINQNRNALKDLKDFNAAAIGVLMGDCFPLSFVGDLSQRGNPKSKQDGDLCTTVYRAITVMEILLRTSFQGDTTPKLFEDIFAAVDRESKHCQSQNSQTSAQPPTHVNERLLHIHEVLIPGYTAQSVSIVNRFGRPSRLVRYWLPLSVAALSGSTLLKVLISRRFELLRWVAEIGSTCLEFWSNWVMEPVQKLIGTIRHDDKSEIALMSKNSLQADRASLERMVVDFVLDRDGSRYGNREIDTSTITDRVREGDLTPVLKAYEKDLRTPFIGTVRGDLVRALLIQVQKTKVDVEIAIGGIDALLKSQELVFGFVGLTPGIMVTYACLQWGWAFLGNKKGLRMGRKQDEFRHSLRNVHRALLLPPRSSGFLAYKNHGLLICETECLLKKAEMILSRADLRVFREDIGDLIRADEVYRQLSVVERLGWTYAKWMS